MLGKSALYGKCPRFIPQRMNRAAVRAGYCLARALARSRYRVRIEIGPEDLQRLQAANRGRSILIPNHPQPADWLILYLLSARTRHPCYFMTAHEQFSGMRRFWLPGFGAYSIRRGGWGDRGSIEQSLRLLRRPDASLVMFAEGRCSFLSQDLLEFRPGAARIGFNYLSKAHRQAAAELTLLPVAISYQYAAPIFDRLDERIERLQQFLSTSTSGSRTGRIDALALRVLDTLEDCYGRRASGECGTWRQRNLRLCERILSDSETTLGIERAPRRSIADRACNIRQRLALNGHRHGIVDRSTYWQAYYPSLLALVLESLAKIDFSAPASLIRQADLLCSLERIAYRIPDPPPYGPRRAVIRVGDATRLSEWLDDYRLDKQGTCNRITARLQHGVARGLLHAGGKPVDCGHGFAERGESTDRPADPLSHG